MPMLFQWTSDWPLTSGDLISRDWQLVYCQIAFSDNCWLWRFPLRINERWLNSEASLNVSHLNRVAELAKFFSIFCSFWEKNLKLYPSTPVRVDPPPPRESWILNPPLNRENKMTLHWSLLRTNQKCCRSICHTRLERLPLLTVITEWDQRCRQVWTNSTRHSYLCLCLPVFTMRTMPSNGRSSLPPPPSIMFDAEFKHVLSDFFPVLMSDSEK